MLETIRRLELIFDTVEARRVFAKDEDGKANFNGAPIDHRHIIHEVNVENNVKNEEDRNEVLKEGKDHSKQRPRNRENQRYKGITECEDNHNQLSTEEKHEKNQGNTEFVVIMGKCEDAHVTESPTSSCRN